MSIFRIVLFYFFVVLFLLICVPLSFANAVQFSHGDIITGTNGGRLYHYSSTGSLLDTLQTEYTIHNIATPLCFDPHGNVRVGNSTNNTISEFSINGILSHSIWGGPYNGLPTRCVTDNLGNFYVYVSEIFGETNLIRKFTSGGTLVKTYVPEYETTNTGTYDNKGLYSMSLASDNCTMRYTSVQSVSATTGIIKQFDVCTDTQLPDFAEVPTPNCTDIRNRNNGEVFVSCGANIYLLSTNGTVIRTYQLADGKLLPASQVSYSLDLDPDGTHLWAGGNFSGNIYKITISTGAGSDIAALKLPAADPVWNTLVGLLVFGSASNPTEPSPTPTSFPTVSPTPIQSGQAPEPFLDLPWDYKSQGKTFEEVALNPNSWFDHAYPLQNFLCCILKVRIYTGEEIVDYYRSHSGYDYPRPLGSSVVAAGEGFATFEPESDTGGGGNVIKIDHGNGYQTWYEHLSLHNIIVSTKNIKVPVQKGQKIGEVGLTGNSNGPHIHLSVFKDINNNGSFNDDYPYGLVDPLGWEGKETDPWTLYGSGTKKGAASYNLFLARAKPKEAVVAQANGGELVVEDKLTVSILPDTLPLDFSFQFKDGPFITDASRSSAAPSFFLDAYTALGEQITQFYKPIRIIYHYSRADLMNIQENSLLLYYLNEATNTWEPLKSTVNTTNKTVTAETTHFSHFALMGKIKDQQPPTTSIVLKGEKGTEGWYRSDVSVTLSGKENTNGVGLETTLYKLDDQEWQKYTGSFSISSEGAHMISYLSIDKVDNTETIKTKQFVIDKRAPEAMIMYDLSKHEFTIHEKASTGSAITEKKVSSKEFLVTLTDTAGNRTNMKVEKKKNGLQNMISVLSIQYNAKPWIKIDENFLYAVAGFDRKNVLTELDQYFLLKGDKRIYTHYLNKQKKTEIYIKSLGTRYQREEKAGFVLLQLYTENGTLKYSY